MFLPSLILDFHGALFVRQIARWVKSPEITAHCLASGAEIAVTNIQPGTFLTTAFEQMFADFQARHQRIGRIAPDFLKRTLFHIAKRMMLRKLVAVDITLIIDIRKSDTRAVAAVNAQKI